MKKRALKKRREELRELLADRREALGELVLGMHVQGIWDDGLLARGAAEVREVEDGLAELEDDEVSSEAVEVTESTEQPERDAPGTAPTETDGKATEKGERGRRRWGLRRKEDPEEGDAASAANRQAAAHPEFETAEHTAEHRLPPEAPGVPEPPEDRATERAGKDSAERGSTSGAPPAMPEETKPEPTTPAPVKSESEARVRPGGDSEAGAHESARSSAREAAAAPSAPKPSTPKPSTPMVRSDATPPTDASPLDALDRRLEQEERAARTGVEAAKASVNAESGTEISSLLETLARDRESLDQALSSASTRLSEAERRASEASERASRVEAENREAAARWVREQAAEIEADAAVAAELAESRPTPGSGDEAQMRNLEAEVQSLRKELDDERREKARAIESAEGRLREIEARAVEVESARAKEPSEGPSASELREAAVGWLRGQIVALRREIESAERKDRGGS